MKTLNMSRFRLAIICMIGAIFLIAGCEKEPVLNNETSPILDETENSKMDEPLTFSADSLSIEEISSLMFMVEQEKLAKDIYTLMFNLYGLKIFENISLSEIKHVDAISGLIEKYLLDNPITDKAIGEFANEDLQELYNDLIAMGSVSQKEALNVGVIIEETNIEKIQYYLDFVVESEDITQVFTNLLNSSDKHLARFISKLENISTEIITVSAEDLSTEEISSLMFMVEQEKLAMDVYTVMFNLYGLKIFENISLSEEKHVDAISRLIEKYILDNPITDKAMGEFVNEDLQEFYNNLIAIGSVSEEEALNVGVMIEESNIEKIQYYLDFVVESENIMQVYTNLINSSGNHMARFVSKLE
ncbi:MAG: DUF2202 domain-containing protein [Bacteroidales bacterium]|nr:DUF2202 domain-containing protein [Bacteroidales bacterium]